jgi:hypothetical protein
MVKTKTITAAGKTHRRMAADVEPIQVRGDDSQEQAEQETAHHRRDDIGKASQCRSGPAPSPGTALRS